jgi:ABC-type transport system involved in Fe-S cluster assembly fused permease/ATPase subunit
MNQEMLAATYPPSRSTHEEKLGVAEPVELRGLRGLLFLRRSQRVLVSAYASYDVTFPYDNASREEVIEAVKAAQAHAFIVLRAEGAHG